MFAETQSSVCAKAPFNTTNTPKYSDYFQFSGGIEGNGTLWRKVGGELGMGQATVYDKVDKADC